MSAAAPSLDRRMAILTALARVHREECNRAGFNRDICVLASWTGREVLRRFGISAKPVAVRALVANAIAWEHAGGDWEQLIAGEFGRPEGGWVMLIGAKTQEPQPGRWSGHLVLAARNPDVLLDLTLDQANRPEKQIEFEPLLEEVPRVALRNFEAGDGALAYKSDSGAHIAYVMIPGLAPASGRDWNAAGDEEVRAFRDRLTDRIEARVREEVDGR